LHIWFMEGFLGHCALDAWVVELNVLYWSLFSRCDRLGCSAYSSFWFAFLKCFNCWALSCW
jgi:hypothetical protein